MTDEPKDLPPAVAVSPEDQSSDRLQSDTDHAQILASTADANEVAVAANTDDRTQSDADQAVNVESNRDDREVADAADAAAVASQAGARSEREEARLQADAHQAVTVGMLGEMKEALIKTGESNETLALAMVEYQERAKKAAERDNASRRRDRNLLLAVIGGFGVTVLLLFGAVVFLLNDAQKGRDQIASCTTPTGECYKRGQENQGVALQFLLDGNQEISAVSAACASEYVNLPLDRRVVAVKNCVEKFVTK